MFNFEAIIEDSEGGKSTYEFYIYVDAPENE